MHSDHPWMIVVPTYAWRIPRIVEEWLQKTPLSGSKEIYFVMSCGGNIGGAGKYLLRLCKEKQLNYHGCFPIVMPENYIALFSTPTKEEALHIIQKAEKEIDACISYIQDKGNFPEISLTMKDKLNSGIVNDVFYPLFVHAKKFYADSSCIACGVCENVCPLNTIHIQNKKPIWGKNCTHCMACISRCPKEAIEYGKHSKDLPRYTCPK